MKYLIIILFILFNFVFNSNIVNEMPSDNYQSSQFYQNTAINFAYIEDVFCKFGPDVAKNVCAREYQYYAKI